MVADVVSGVIAGTVEGRLAHDIPATARRIKAKARKYFIVYFSSNVTAFFMFSTICTEKGQRSSQLPQAEQSEARRSMDR
jgi:hypothetical protein